MSSINPGPIGPATTTRRGTMSAADKVKVNALTGTNTGDVTVASPAGWLSLVGQALTFALVSAGAGVAGVIDFGAQVIAGVKTFTSAIIASAGVQLASLWNANGTGASDVGVKIGVSTADASVNTDAKLASFRTGVGGVEVEKSFVYKDGTMVVDVGGNAIGFGKFIYARSGGFLFDSGSGILGLFSGAQARLWTSLASGASGAAASFEATEFLATAGAGIPGVLRSAQGAAAADIAVKVGTSIADASVNATAKMLSVRTGLNGTEVEKFWVGKDGVRVVGARVPSIRAIGGSSYFYGDDDTNGYLQWNTVNWHFNSTGVSALNTMTGGWITNAANGVNGFGLATAGSRISLNTSDALVYFAAIAVGIINTPAEVEITTAAKGVILKSPDGTRYRLTVANGGTLSITAA